MATFSELFPKDGIYVVIASSTSTPTTYVVNNKPDSIYVELRLSTDSCSIPFPKDADMFIDIAVVAYYDTLDITTIPELQI